MLVPSLLLLGSLVASIPGHVTARTVNISSTWFLPQEGFPVFYRYFRDRITWFEADAVCQFHHANLVTVDSSVQFDTVRAYLKELDVATDVWIGLKKTPAMDKWAWTDYKPLTPDGYWLEHSPRTPGSLCAAIDPVADFRWHSRNCGGPEVASFVCELPVPPWARREDGCMLTALPSLTVTFLPEQAAVELTSDCGLDGTRRIACKGQANRDEMIRQLSCDAGETSQEGEETASSSSSSTPGASSTSVSGAPPRTGGTTGTSGTSGTSGTAGTRAWSWTAEPPTRHRRDAVSVSASDMAGTAAVSQEESTVSSTAASHDRGTSPLSAEVTAVSRHEEVTPTRHPVSSGQQPGDDMTAYTYNVSNDQANIQTTAAPIVTSGIISESLTPGNSDNNNNNHLMISIKSASTVNVTNPTAASHSNMTEMSVSSKESTPVTTTVTPAGADQVGHIADVEDTSMKSAANESKMTVDDEEKRLKDEEAIRRRQFLPAALRGVPYMKVDNATSTARSAVDWAPVADEEGGAMEEDPEEAIKSFEPEPEIPARPNRGRRLTRPQGHSFYPYFLNRVLG